MQPSVAWQQREIKPRSRAEAFIGKITNCSKYLGTNRSELILVLNSCKFSNILKLENICEFGFV